MATTSCMLPNPMACCASCDVTTDTLHDVIPLPGALRDVITLSSQCHGLLPPTKAVASSSPPRLVPPPPVASAAMGVSQHSDNSLQGHPSPAPAPSPPSSPSSPRPSVKRVLSLVSFDGDSPTVKDEVDHQLPLLKVASKDLRYRGEGAEHIVLRVLTSGQVLRIRKTAVGASSTKRDLVIRATKDEEFLHNVARPILGPLLTDESRLVCLDTSTVQELRDALAPKRQANRRHKEINNEGVACICPDAASIFISRTSPSQSSSPASSSSSSISPLISPSPLLSHDVIISSSSSLRVSNEQVLDNVQSVHWSGRDAQSIARVNSFSWETSQGAKAGKNLRNNQTSSTSSFHNDAYEVENGLCSDSKVSMASDFCSIQEKGDCPMNSLSNVSSVSSFREPRNICIEVKPKQGFIDTSTPELPLCRYCVKQYIKVEKEADQGTSSYCPLDLFSGDLMRMRKAVDGLLESPQNNFKVFVDGEPVDNCLSFRYLRDVIIAALTYDFRTAKVEVNESGPLSPCSPLGKTLAFQMLDKLGVYHAANLYRHLVKIMGQSKAADELLQDLKCWTGDSQFCQASSKLCTRCSQEDIETVNGVNNDSFQSYIDKSSEKNRHGILMRPSMKKNNASDYMATDIENYVNPNWKQENSLSLTSMKNISDNGIAGESSSQNDIIRKLQEYILSTTAKDLSLMILLNGPHKSSPVPCNTVNSSPFIIELEDNTWFQCQVTGVDLVAKPPSKILKHEQDYMCLKAVLEDLQKQGKGPACCK